MPHNLTESARTIATIIEYTLGRGSQVVEVTREAEEAWVAKLLSGPARLIGAPDCTPGYYNNEGGEPTPLMRTAVGFPAGPSAYFRYLDGWRTAGVFEGLVIN